MMTWEPVFFFGPIQTIKGGQVGADLLYSCVLRVCRGNGCLTYFEFDRKTLQTKNDSAERRRCVILAHRRGLVKKGALCYIL